MDQVQGQTKEQPVVKGRLSEIAKLFTRDIQKALEECTVGIPPGRSNHPRLTREGKEVVSLNNKVKRFWNKWRLKEIGEGIGS